MRFLADAGISPKTIDFLRRNGHETEALASGVLILVEDIRYRIRRLPIR